MSIFKTFFKLLYSTKGVPQKSCLLGKIGSKNCVKFSLGGIFPGEDESQSIRVCFEDLWSHICTTLVFECPPPLPNKILSAFIQAQFHT